MEFKDLHEGDVITWAPYLDVNKPKVIIYIAKKIANNEFLTHVLGGTCYDNKVYSCLLMSTHEKYYPTRLLEPKFSRCKERISYSEPSDYSCIKSHIESVIYSYKRQYEQQKFWGELMLAGVESFFEKLKGQKK